MHASKINSLKDTGLITSLPEKQLKIFGVISSTRVLIYYYLMLDPTDRQELLQAINSCELMRGLVQPDVFSEHRSHSLGIGKDHVAFEQVLSFQVNIF